jgi:hypothetical protein
VRLAQSFGNFLTIFEKFVPRFFDTEPATPHWARSLRFDLHDYLHHIEKKVDHLMTDVSALLTADAALDKSVDGVLAYVATIPAQIAAAVASVTVDPATQAALANVVNDINAKVVLLNAAVATPAPAPAPAPVVDPAPAPAPAPAAATVVTADLTTA